MDTPYFDWFVRFIFRPAKVGIKSCKFAGECVFICAWMDVTTQLELCLHKQTQIIANTACRVHG